MISITEFQSLPHQSIREMVTRNGPQVCVFTFNGTRRWYLLENLGKEVTLESYIDALSTRVIEIAKLFFDFGVRTLVMPVLSPFVLNRRDGSYQQFAVGSLDRFSVDPRYRQFYDEYEISAHVYGDYDKYLPNDIVPHLSQKFLSLATQTRRYQKHRVFWGICAHDAMSTITELTVSYFKKTGRTPSKQSLINMYYGAPIGPVDIYIGSGKPRVFDIPLISTGQESLYFSLAPSPYFDETQLRYILYDHMFQRNTEEGGYQVTPVTHQRELRRFYFSNHNSILGVGVRNQKWQVWHSLPQASGMDYEAV